MLSNHKKISHNDQLSGDPDSFTLGHITNIVNLAIRQKQP
jgi:hypothetical protein